MSLSVKNPLADEYREAVNFGERRGVTAPDILLLHYTGMEDGEGAVRWLCCEESGVSCHYLVHEDGRIVQMVDEALRAHHAGAGSWEGNDDVNSRSIGVEIVNFGHEGDLPVYPDVQMNAVIALSADIINRHNIRPWHVLGHSDTAIGRKIDPGEHFDWKLLHQNGIGHFVEPAPIGAGGFFQQGDTGEPIEALQSMLALYGYGLNITGQFCENTHKVVEAFQRHFRPERVDGVADPSTLDTLHRLLRARAELF